MQITINISDSLYDRLMDMNIDSDTCSFNESALVEAIQNGTPLPKGHGRLGDLSKIYVDLNEAQIEGTEEYKGLGKAKQIICDAPTIIEADKAESEDKND